MDTERGMRKFLSCLDDNLEQWIGWKGYGFDNVYDYKRFLETGEWDVEKEELLGVNGKCFPFKVENGTTQFFYPVELPKKEPKLVPFDNCEEFVDWFRERVGIKASGIAEPLIWVKDKKTGIYALIDGLDFDENHLPVHLLGEWITLERLSERFTLLDGTPIGKRV